MTIPDIRWPKASGLYKVVQFEFEQHPFLRLFLWEEGRYHRDIVERFALEVKVPTKRGESGVAMPLDERLRIVGAGACGFDAEKRFARFGGHSDGYGISIDAEHLRKLDASGIEIKFEPTWL